MSIYLHPIDEKPDDINQDKWVEIDLVSWKSGDKEYPTGVTLLRRLAFDVKQPYLQELMFKDLYKGLPIKQITIEIPRNLGEPTIDVHILKDVKVIHYVIHPPRDDHKKAYEKIILVAKSKTMQ